MTYENAIIKHNAAINAYELVRDAYRNRTVGDAEFLAAKAIYDAATAELDIAFAAAQEA